MTAVSESFVIDTENSTNNAFQSIKYTIEGTGLDNLTFYIGEKTNIINLLDATYETYYDASGTLGTNDAIAIAFNNNGTKMYLLENSVDYVRQFNLSTAWNVSTATYASKHANVHAQDGSTTGLEFNSDGTKMYVCGLDNKKIFQYTLSTAWDVSTASYASKSGSFAGETTRGDSLSISSDGTKLYLTDDDNNKILQYTLSTAWDISTMTYASKYANVSSQAIAPLGIYINNDGTKLFVADNTTRYIFQYTLSIAWDISTAIYDNIYLDTTLQTTDVRGIAVSSTETKIYAVDYLSSKVYQYNIGIIRYTEVPTTGTTTSRTSAIIPLTDINKYGLNWKVINTGGDSATMTKLIIDYTQV